MTAIAVRNVMTAGVESTETTSTVQEVARRLRDADVGSLVITGEGEPVGIVTDTDLVDVLVDGDDPESVTAGEVMSSPLVTIGADDSVASSVRRMHDTGVSTLPVVEDGEVVGVVTTHDLAHYVPQVLHRATLSPPDEGESAPQFAVRPDTTHEHGDWTFDSRASEEGRVSVGDRVEFTKTLADEDVRAFAEASGDTNRLHLDDAYAAETRFGERIAHGTLVGGLISAALARLPGLTIYLSQDLSFRKPVDVDAQATAVCEVVEDLGDDRYVLTTDVHSDDQRVIEGEAVVVVDAVPDVAQSEDGAAD
jgi:acyl dehydratase/predicted transcriptional regulator